MATQAKSGFKTKFQRDDGTGTFTTIAEVLDITGPEITKLLDDATNQDSPDWVERIGIGLRDGGQVSFSMHLLQDDAGHNALYADQGTVAARNYRVVLASQTKRISFAAHCEKVGHAFPVKGKMVNDVTMTITGPSVLENHP